MSKELVLKLATWGAQFDMSKLKAYSKSRPRHFDISSGFQLWYIHAS